MVQVEDAQGLGETVSDWLTAPEKAHEVGRAAYQLVASNRGALARHLEIIDRDIFS